MNRYSKYIKLLFSITLNCIVSAIIIGSLVFTIIWMRTSGIELSFFESVYLIKDTSISTSRLSSFFIEIYKNTNPMLKEYIWKMSFVFGIFKTFFTKKTKIKIIYFIYIGLMFLLSVYIYMSIVFSPFMIILFFMTAVGYLSGFGILYLTSELNKKYIKHQY